MKNWERFVLAVCFLAIGLLISIWPTITVTAAQFVLFGAAIFVVVYDGRIPWVSIPNPRPMGIRQRVPSRTAAMGWVMALLPLLIRIGQWAGWVDPSVDPMETAGMIEVAASALIDAAMNLWSMIAGLLVVKLRLRRSSLR